MKLLNIFNKKRKQMKLDIIILLLMPIVASILSIIFKVTFFTSCILFFLLPSLYLSYRGRKYVYKAIKFTLLTLIFIIPIDYAASISKQWALQKSIFSFQIGYTSIEAIIWTLSYVYLVVMFYQYFLDKHVILHTLNKTRQKGLVAFYIVMAITGILMSLLYPYVSNFSYYYLLGGILFVLIPIYLVEANYPQLIVRFFKAGVYFFILTFLYEITALKLGWWYFPIEGKFIGQFSLFNLSFPLEELIFWIILGSMSFLSYFEYYDDLK